MPEEEAPEDPRREAWRLVWPPLAVAKAVSLAVTLLTVWLQPVGTANLLSRLREAFVHWDAVHYLSIAAQGYPPQLDFHDAFFPGYPLLLAAAGVAVRDKVVAALLLSLAAEALALYYIARLVMAERDVGAARFAVWCVALGPLAFFFSAVYPDAVIVAAMAAALHHGRQGRWRPAAVAAAIAVSMRLTGLVLVPVLLYEHGRRSGWRPRRDSAWLLLPPLPLLAYMLYLRLHTGDALAFIHAQSLPIFNLSAAWPWEGFDLTWRTLVSSDGEVQEVFVREVGFAFMGWSACVAAWLWPRFPRALALHCTLVMVLATSLAFWRSVPRYDLALFPVVIMLADISRGRWGRQLLRPALLGSSGALLAWGAWTFARGHWLG